jgi:hypothetical protein
MSIGDRFDITLDVTVEQVNNGRARLGFKTDNGTIVRFWYGVELLPIKHDPQALRETCH